MLGTHRLSGLEGGLGSEASAMVVSAIVSITITPSKFKPAGGAQLKLYRAEPGPLVLRAFSRCCRFWQQQIAWHVI